jgi:hypothetical protein
LAHVFSRTIDATKGWTMPRTGRPLKATETHAKRVAQLERRLQYVWRKEQMTPVDKLLASIKRKRKSQEAQADPALRELYRGRRRTYQRRRSIRKAQENRRFMDQVAIDLGWGQPTAEQGK